MLGRSAVASSKLSPEQSHTLKVLESEREELQRRLLVLEGEIEYHQGMIGLHQREVEQIELKIQDLSQSIISLDNA